MNRNRITSSGGRSAKSFPGVSRFDALDDTFTYPGNAGKVAVVNPGETALIPVALAAIDDHKVITSNTDTTPGYLNAKLEAGTNINITEDSSVPANHRAKIDSTAQLSNLPDVLLTAPQPDQSLFFNGTKWINKNPPAAGGISTAFYLEFTAGPDAGYSTLTKYPTGNVEKNDSATVSSGSGPLPIDVFETAAALGRSIIDPGLWKFNTFCKVDALVGINQIQIDIIKRTAGGVETILFSVIQDIDSITTDLLSLESVQPSFVIATTDKLVARYYAMTSSVANRLITLVYNGTAHFSNFETPFSQLHNELSGLQGGSGTQFYHSTANQNAALAGTNGAPAAGNPYVTDSDPRNTNARTPTAHPLAQAPHTADTITNLNSLLTDGFLITSKANEFNGLVAKVSTTVNDRLVIEDFADANKKKAINISVLPFPIRGTTVDIAFSDLAIAALTNSILLFTLPSAGIIIGTRLKPEIIFSGPAITSYFLSLGVAGNTADIMTEYDVKNIAISDTEYAEAMAFQSFNYNNTTAILITARSVGANLSAANQGTAKIEVYYIPRLF
jgi:hypothetical protein